MLSKNCFGIENLNHSKHPQNRAYIWKNINLLLILVSPQLVDIWLADHHFGKGVQL